MASKFRITYATMSADNEELQSAFDAADGTVKASWPGAEVPMFINGERVFCDEKFQRYSPVDTGIMLCSAQLGTAEHAKAAIAAARGAFNGWRRSAWQDRVTVVRRIAEAISDNSLEFSALMCLEVGKNRLEALGEVEETADLLRYYAASMEKNRGFVNELGKYNPDDPKEKNLSVLHPYGVWVVIAPFNYPMALSAAPIAAALLTGNTVVFKGASDTPYCAWKTAELFAAAGLPPGVFNYVSGLGRSVGQELQDNPDIDGWTFTGSYETGMKIFAKAAMGRFPRMAIVEMGGKNPAIVSAKADICKAAMGVMRSAFGLDGQKCSACSRVYIQEEAYPAFRTRLLEMTGKIVVGDPTERGTYMGTVINKAAYDNYKKFAEKARTSGVILTGGRVLSEGKLAKGYYVTPTIVEGLPEEHELVRNELFLPILHMAPVKTLDEAMQKANDTIYGLTAGFFGDDPVETEWFFENIQAGTTYSNRANGATTGAWPGIQVFTGWKGSGSSGKGIGGLYSLALYMREQSRTMIG